MSLISRKRASKSIATAYMSIDIGTNHRNISFNKAKPILKELCSEKFTIFDTYTEENVSE
jgi:hypothetical protein